MLQACLLAVIAGYADAIGYLRHDAFAGLMTGNTIFLGVGLATGKFVEAAFHLAIIAVFLAGVVISRGLIIKDFAPFHALCLTSILLVLCGFLPGGPAAFVLALAMGMQNAAANRFNGVALNTVFVTGNLQKLGEGIVAWLWAPGHERGQVLKDAAIYAYVWIAYAVGAAGGALAHQVMAYPLLLPALLLPLIMPANRPT